MESKPTSRKLIYGIEDRPPLGKAVVLSAQHVLTMFGSTVSIPLLFGPAMGMSLTQIGTLISSVMLCSGVATLIQATFGSRLPIIQGVSFAFIAAFFGIIGVVLGPVEKGGMNGDANLCMQYIAGAVIAGAAVEMFIGFSGLMGYVRKILSPVVVGPVIMLIGLALFQHGAPKAGTNWAISGLTMALIILFSLVFSHKNRFLRLFPILSAIAIVVTLCWGLSTAGVFKPEIKNEAGEVTQAKTPGYVDLTAVENSPWVRVNPSEVILPWGVPKFHLGFFFAVLAAYMASMIESFGDYHACSQMAGGGDPSGKQISRGIGCEGIGCALSGFLGGFSSTSYSENIGLVGLTKVGSRYVVQLGAVILILLGFFAKFGAIAAAIPEPVVGGLYCVMFGLISAVGVQQLAKCDLHDDRNLLIAGFSLFMGLSMPAYFSAKAAIQSTDVLKTLASYQPTAEPMLSALPKSISGIVESIGSTGMAVAAIIGLVLDNFIPGSKQSRGLEDPGVLVPEAGDISIDP